MTPYEKERNKFRELVESFGYEAKFERDVSGRDWDLQG